MIKHISPSLVNTWSMCPERVRRRYINGEIIPPGIAAKLGTGVHKGAEVNHRQKITSRKDEPLDVVTDAARDGYTQALKDGTFFPPDEQGTAKKQMAEGVDKVVSLAKLYHSDLAPTIQPVLVEKWLEMDVPGFDVPIVGIIDVATEDNRVPDIKTASKSWPKGRADQSIQATFYNELYRAYSGEYPAGLEFDILVNTKTPRLQIEKTERTPDDWRVLERRLEIMVASIKAGLFPPADPGHWCCSYKWCGYFYTCPHIPAHKKIIPKKST